MSEMTEVQPETATRRRRPGRPRKDGSIPLTFEQLKELLESKGQGAITPEAIANIAATAATKAKKPENIDTHKISNFNPEGDRANPRPAKLKCAIYFGGAPLETQTMTHREIAAANALTPGYFRVEKTDGSQSIVEVHGQVNANRSIEKLIIRLPDDDPIAKNMYGRLHDMLEQMVDANRVEPAA